MQKFKKYVKLLINILIPVIVIYLIFTLVPKILLYFMPFVIGWIIAMIANPLVRLLDRKLKVKRKITSVLIVVLVLAGIIGLFIGIFNKLSTEVTKLIDDSPAIVENIKESFDGIVDKYNGVYQKMPENVKNGIDGLLNEWGSALGKMVKSDDDGNAIEMVSDVANGVTTAFVQIIVTILASYFFIADKDILSAKLAKMFPESLSEGVGLAWRNVKKAICGYLIAQIKIMAVVFALLLIGFLILGVNYAVLLALLIAFLDALPVFGTGTALGPWAVYALLTGDYKLTIGLVVIYIVTQVVRQLIQPKLVGDSLDLNPLLTLLFLYIGFKVASIGGMIIAVPIGMIFVNFYKEGVFDLAINSAKELVHDFNTFRRS